MLQLLTSQARNEPTSQSGSGSASEEQFQPVGIISLIEYTSARFSRSLYELSMKQNNNVYYVTERSINTTWSFVLVEVRIELLKYIQIVSIKELLFKFVYENLYHSDNHFFHLLLLTRCHERELAGCSAQMTITNLIRGHFMNWISPYYSPMSIKYLKELSNNKIIAS